MSASSALKFREVAKQFAKWGVSTLPVNRDKLPNAEPLIAAGFKVWEDPSEKHPEGRWKAKWKPLQSRVATDIEIDTLWPLDNSHGIAVASGDVFCIDIDEKHNHIDEDIQVVALLRDRMYKAGLADHWDDALLQQTRSGGQHLIFRCKDPERTGNKKLASNIDPDDGKPKAFLETRGYGGYFLINPSHGYELLPGVAREPRPMQWRDMPLYDVATKEAMLEVCRSFNQVIKKGKDEPRAAPTKVGAEVTPGEHFNQICRQKPEMVEALLNSNGWSHVDAALWRRPGKDSGVSATYNSPDIGGNAAFYVFSTSTEFESETIYQPWHVYAMLECGGDYSKASGDLRAAGFGGERESPGKAPEASAPAPTSPEGDEVAPSSDEFVNPFANGIGAVGNEVVEGSDEWWEQGTRELESVTWAGLERSKIEIPPVVIDGLLYRGGMCMLSAPSKACKSWTLIDIAMSVATGTSWGGLECAQTNVLYVNFELLAGKMRERVCKIAHTRGLPSCDNLHFLNLRGEQDISLPSLKREIVRMCRDKDIGMVIVDPIYLPMIAEHLDENLVGDVAGFLQQLAVLAKRAHTSVMYAHHFAKGDSTLKEVGDRAAGSGAFGRFVDCQIVLTPPPFGGEYSETNTGKRYMSLELVQRDFDPFTAKVVAWKFPRWANTSISMSDFMQKAGKGKKK